MKIIIVSRSLPYVGGREIVVENLIQRLSKYHSILLLTPDATLKRKGIKVVDCNTEERKLERIIKKFNPDIINCHTFYYFRFSLKLSRHYKIPIVTTLHGMFLRFYGKYYYSYIKFICNESDAITVVSDSYKKELEKTLDIPSGKIFVIRNGINRIKVNRKKIYLRKKYSLPNKKFLIIVPSRINKIKGVEYIVRAANKMSGDKFFFLVCYPDGRQKNPEENLYRKKIMKLNPSDKVLQFRMSSHSELQDLFKIADVCLLPSLMEGISISLLEAMSNNCFIIATNVGGTPEIINDRKNGLLIKSRSVTAIIQALQFFESLSPRTRKLIVSKAFNTVKEDFSDKKMVQSYMKLFSTLKY